MPRLAIAHRQPTWSIRSAVSGAARKMPSPIPENATPFTAPRAVGNQRLRMTSWATLPKRPAPGPATHAEPQEEAQRRIGGRG